MVTTLGFFFRGSLVCLQQSVLEQPKACINAASLAHVHVTSEQPHVSRQPCKPSYSVSMRSHFGRVHLYQVTELTVWLESSGTTQGCIIIIGQSVKFAHMLLLRTANPVW